MANGNFLGKYGTMSENNSIFENYTLSCSNFFSHFINYFSGQQGLFEIIQCSETYSNDGRNTEITDVLNQHEPGDLILKRNGKYMEYGCHIEVTLFVCILP